MKAKTQVMAWMVMALAVSAFAQDMGAASQKPLPKIKLEYANGEMRNNMTILGEGTLGQLKWKNPRAAVEEEVVDFLKRVRWHPAEYPGTEFALLVRDGMASQGFPFQVVANRRPLSAPEDMSAWAEAFKSALREEAKRAVAGVDVEAELAKNQQKLEAAALELRQAEIQQRSVGSDNDLNGVNIGDLTGQRKMLEAGSTDKKARRMALQMSLADEMETQTIRKKEDPIAAELRKLVDIRVETANTLRNLAKSGLGGTADVLAAEAALSEAKLRLLEREEAISKTGKGELIDKLTTELRMVTVDQTQIEIQMKLVDDQLAAARKKESEWNDRRRKAQDRYSTAQLNMMSARTEHLQKKVLMLLGEAEGW